MKKLVLGLFVFSFFVLSQMQAEWKEFTYKNKFALLELEVGSSQDIWAIGRSKVANESGAFMSSLLKWSEEKKMFEKQGLVPVSRQKMYAFKGGLAVLFPKGLDVKSKAFRQRVFEKLFLFAQEELKKLVVAKKIPQGVVDKFVKTWVKHQNAALMSIRVPSFIEQVYPEAKDKNVFNSIMGVSEMLDNKERELMQKFVPSFTRPLKLFVDGKSETVRDFKGLKVLAVKVIDVNDIWVVTTNKDPKRPKKSPNHFIEHWDGKEWKKMGEAKMHFSNIRIGNDGSVFVKQMGKGLQKWEGSSLKDTLIDFEEYITDFSVINSNDIWFSRKNFQDKNYVTMFFHWNGKEVEQRGSFKTFQQVVAAAPGIALVLGYGEKIYRWIDEPKKSELILPKINGRITIKSLESKKPIN